jgi:PHAX RNA-binding domain-containing protein
MDETAQQIAEALGESDENPRTQIAGIVAALGAEGALALLAQTQRVEEAGGLLVPDGTRRRTPGGVFFLLAREKLTPADRAKIFSAKQQKAAKATKTSPEGTAEPPRRRVYEYVPEPRPGRGAPGPVAGRRGGPKPAEVQGGAGGEGRGATPAPAELKRSLRRAQARREIAVILGKVELTDQYLVLVDLFAEVQERARAAGRSLTAVLEPSGESQPETEH